MVIIRLDNLEQYETYHPCLNRKRLLIFILASILLYIFYSFVPRKNQLPCITVIDIKEKKSISPFHRTLGFIRWNSAHPDRIPIMEKYRPFFANLHYSMPDYTSKLNYTADGWKPGESAYKPLADTMQIILQNYSTIEGILYFHFDAWINPFRFDDMNFRNIWFPDANLPPFRCVENTVGWGWWAWDAGFHNVAKAATKNVAKNYSKRFITNENVFCGGWSDIYYIPRRFFNDFIDLTNIFYTANSFHEVAIPTMINIIDLTHRSTPHHTIIIKIRDCWGDCCANGAGPGDIQQRRCGHRMDLANDNIKKTLIQLLDSETAYLNSSIKKAR